MMPGILAGLVDIEVMMRMFDGRDAQPFADEMRDDLTDEHRLAGAAPSRKAKNPGHARLRPSPMAYSATHGRPLQAAACTDAVRRRRTGTFLEAGVLQPVAKWLSGTKAFASG